MGEKPKSKVTLDGELLFPNEYIAAESLKGRDVTLTISDVSVETLKVKGGGEEDKPVLRFQELERRKNRGPSRLVKNKTNAQTIAGMYGAEAKKWVGCRITLFPTTCLAFGETVTCVRIRAQKPTPKGKTQPEPDQGFDPSTGEVHPDDEPDMFDDANEDAAE